MNKRIDPPAWKIDPPSSGINTDGPTSGICTDDPWWKIDPPGSGKITDNPII